MVGYGGSSAGSYLTDPTSPIPSHCASIVVTSTLRVNRKPWCISAHCTYFFSCHDFCLCSSEMSCCLGHVRAFRIKWRGERILLPEIVDRGLFYYICLDRRYCRGDRGGIGTLHFGPIFRKRNLHRTHPFLGAKDSLGEFSFTMRYYICLSWYCTC